MMSDFPPFWSDPLRVRALIGTGTCIGLLLSSAEWLIPGWKLTRLTLLASSPLRDTPIERIWRSAGLRIAFCVRMVCAAIFVLSVLHGLPSRTGGIAFLGAGLLSLPLRLQEPVSVFTGMDGAERLMISVSLVLGATFVLDSKFAIETALVFVAVQVMLEYASAGWTKLRARTLWWSGFPVQLVLSHSHYGHPYFGALAQRRLLFARMLAVGIIVLEIALPFAIVLPRPFGELLLLAGITFHVASAVTMGLNTFVFAFVATYPALLHLRDLLLY